MKTCSTSCSWLNPLREKSLLKIRGGSDPLKKSDHKPFLEKVCANKSQATEILSAIGAGGGDLASLLSTPLLLTLLVLLYRVQTAIPNTLARFYEQLFDVLFIKHDQTKPGFRRARHTALDESQLKRMFEAFSFVSQMTNKIVFTESEFSDCIAEATTLTGIDVTASGFKKELIKTACLLVEDGPEISFIHKSVAEFYAATFVQRSNLEFAQSFYEQLAPGQLHVAWAGELTFLEEIDNYRFSKYLAIPQLKKALAHLEGNDLNGKPNIDIELDEWMNASKISLKKEGDRVAASSLTGGPYHAGYICSDLFMQGASTAFSYALEKQSEPVIRSLFELNSENEDVIWIKFGEFDVATNGALRSKIRSALEVHAAHLKSKLEIHLRVVQREEGKLKLVPLLSKKKLRPAT